ncbi:MAG: TonB-dependent receptor, partial [Bacteroidota bacterium]
ISIIIKTTSGQQLKGRITDKSSGEALPGCTIFIPDLRTGSTTDDKGNYQLEHLPSGEFLVQFRSVGYTSFSKKIDFSSPVSLDIELEKRAMEAGEVVITGTAFASDDRRMSAPVSSIGRLELQSLAAPNLVQALTRIPGVSSLSTGAGIGKPVIRGLGLNRVVTVNQGIRQEGQQWGEEHGLEIDQFAADRIEVMKGPASLQYGSDALGGIVNILEPMAASSGEIRGELNTQYSTNNRLWGGSFMAEGNKDGLIARIRASGKSAASFRTPEERVYNSGFDELSQSVLIGANKRWGYSHLQISNWRSHIGLTEGERNSSGEFVDEDDNPIPENVIDSREIELPSQRIDHLKISSTNNFILNRSQLRFNAGFQQNKRKEFEDLPDEASIHMRLRTLTTDVRYYPNVINGWESAGGFSAMFQENLNLGEEYLIPDYDQKDAGAFLTSKKNLEKTTYEAGARFDIRRIDWQSTLSEGDTIFEAADREFQAFSGSIGMTHSFNEKITIKTSLGRGFRAPSASELTANGLHEGTFRYEIGDKNLRPETSLQFDIGFIAETEYLSLNLSAFANSINNFIYYSNLEGQTTVADNDTFLVYRYVQGKANLRGGELTLDLHPLKEIHFENTISMVISENTSISTPLPFTPPIRTTHALRYDRTIGKKTSMHVTLELENNLAQKRIDVFETETDGYMLLNMAFSMDILMGSRTGSLFIRADNLFNKSYFNNMSRYKEIGVRGMGRNFSIGLQLPLEFKNL